MLTHARDLFVGQGYTETTMEQIALAAGVAVQTVYYTFKTKGALLCETIEQAASIEDAPVRRQAWLAEALSSPSAHRALALTVEHGVDVYVRAAPLWPAVRAASAIDDAVAAYWDGVSQQRRAAMNRLAARYAELGELKTGLRIDRAGDLIYALHSHGLYSALVEQAQWPLVEFKTWLYDTLATQLLTTKPPTEATLGLSFVRQTS